MKRSRSPSFGEDAPELRLRERMANHFRALDTALMTIKMKKKQAMISEIMEATQSLSGDSFREEDLSRILAACPGAYRLEWIPHVTQSARNKTTCSQQLGISVNENWPSERLSKVRVSVTDRMAAFRKVTSDIADLSSLSIVLCLPALPDDEPRQSSGAEVSKVAALAEKVRMDGLVTVGSELKDGETKIAALKTAFLAQVQIKSALADSSRVTKEIELQVSRLRRLPAFCDLLRMIFNRRKRTVLSLSELLHTLADETRLGMEEYKILVNLVCDIIPDFITIVPADDISPIEHLKVNVYCNYTDCMNRLIDYIQVTCGSSTATKNTTSSLK